MRHWIFPAARCSHQLPTSKPEERFETSRYRKNPVCHHNQTHAPGKAPEAQRFTQSDRDGRSRQEPGVRPHQKNPPRRRPDATTGSPSLASRAPGSDQGARGSGPLATALMKTANLHQAKTHLSRLVNAALMGEEVIIARAGKPLVKLVPIEPPKQERRLGMDAGKIFVRDDFDDPMPELEESIYGSAEADSP